MYRSPAIYQNSPLNAAAMSGLYQRVGVETGVDAASPHHLVTMLYDGLLESMALARGALRTNQVDVKCRAISRAVRIIDEGLRCALNTEAGGELATNLSDLYFYVSMRLTKANLRNDDAAIEECIKLIEPLRQAWVSIGDQGSAPVPSMQKVVA
jgi:flagellar protein FliS